VAGKVVLRCGRGTGTEAEPPLGQTCNLSAAWPARSSCLGGKGDQISFYIKGNMTPIPYARKKTDSTPRHFPGANVIPRLTISR
jgi:hypothetical protein